MHLYKITLTVMGDNFYPNNLDMAQIDESMKRNSFKQYKKDDSWNPDDKIGEGRTEEYGCGGMMYMHSNIFVKASKIEKYENDFVSFLEDNDTLFVANSVEKYDLFTEFYYSGAQCNFEVMSRDTLKRLKKLKADVAFPVSVYKMKKKQLKQLLKPLQED